MDFFSLRVPATVTLYLHDEVQRIVRIMAVVHEEDEVWNVPGRFGAVAVRHLQTEMVVLHVGPARGWASATRHTALQLALVAVIRLLAIVVVRLVVEDHHVLHAHELGHDALEHLTLGLHRFGASPARPLSGARPPLESSRRSRRLKTW